MLDGFGEGGGVWNFSQKENGRRRKQIYYPKTLATHRRSPGQFVNLKFEQFEQFTRARRCRETNSRNQIHQRLDQRVCGVQGDRRIHDIHDKTYPPHRGYITWWRTLVDLVGISANLCGFRVPLTKLRSSESFFFGGRLSSTLPLVPFMIMNTARESNPPPRVDSGYDSLTVSLPILTAWRISSQVTSRFY